MKRTFALIPLLTLAACGGAHDAAPDLAASFCGLASPGPAPCQASSSEASDAGQANGLTWQCLFP